MSNFRLFDLNPQQEAAVRQTDGPVLVLAGAGTGKTRVITARVAYLVHQGIPPEQILAVTFTNKAANEMRDRVAGMIDAQAAGAITVCTFHSLCVRILRRSIELLGYKRNFTIYSESEQTSLLRKIITRSAARDEQLDHGLAKFLISRAKNDGLNGPPDNEQTLLAEVFRRYNEELLKLNAVDFDDLLLLAVKVLREFQAERQYWVNSFSHIMVDEFQDTNRLQLEIVQLLAGQQPNVCVVGDDDQSIYSWRGAEVSNILDFEQHFPNPQVIKLEQNYRSSNAILHTANSLISANARRRAKNLWSERGEGEPIRILPLPDDREEAEFVISEIQRIKVADSLGWDQFAVLYRMNMQSRLLEEELRRREIPYRVVGGKSFFDRREVKDFIAYAQVLLNHDDDISLLRIINNPPRGIGENTVKLALAESTSRQCPLRTVLEDTDFHDQLSSRARNALGDFFALLNEYEARITEPLVDQAETLTAWLAASGYVDALPKSCKTAAEGETRLASLHGILDDLRNHQQRSRSGLAGFLDALTLDDNKDQEDAAERKSGVTLITLHAAKGLEFPHVFMVGLEEGLLPHERSKLEGNLDEERRLFYVGITRAMISLTLTRAEHRLKFGEKTVRLPSSFLAELDDKHLHHCTAEEIRTLEPTEQEAEAHFASIREMILKGGS